MDPIVTFDPQWWVTAVELPVLGGLYWLLWRTRTDLDARTGDNRLRTEAGDTRLRERIADFKLEVAKSYASVASLNDVERRLVAHLVRIETKLDRHLAAGGGDAA
jgi:hypothetical protein